MTLSALGIFSAAGAGGPIDAYEQIATSLVGSGGTSSIVFSSIPQIYKHLQVRFVQKPNSAAYSGSIYLTANDNSGGGYNHYLTGNGSVVQSNANANPNLILGQNIQSNGTTNAFNAGVVDILDYNSTTKNKTYRWFFGYTDSQGNRVVLGSSNWTNTSAITALSFFVDGNLAQFSRASLYGIRG